MELKTSLEKIGFYTLSDARVKQACNSSPLWRCEVLLTDACNFKCPYCRGIRPDFKGTMSPFNALKLVDIWARDGLKNIRFSGGEPTVYLTLPELVSFAKTSGIERIAISTNGSASLEYYKDLIERGVNDMSISLDACCSSTGERMAGGVEGSWERVVSNIKALAPLCYITLGMVFDETTVDTVEDVVKFGSSLGVADIRVITAAQYNESMERLKEISPVILKKHPILTYRVENFKTGRNVRGITEYDNHKCALVLDDMAVVGDSHFPCIIYLREGGNPIGKVGPTMRVERERWFERHDSSLDPICSKNCLDVCVDYNNRYRDFHG